MRALVCLVLVGVWASAEVTLDDAPVTTRPRQELARPKKREIYRESVLPALGGVIPEGAFSRQRLRQNVNDQLGIETPDGFLFITRSMDNRYSELDPEDERELLRLLPYDRHTHQNGIFYPQPLPTTYLLRRPIVGRVFVSDYPRLRGRVYPWTVYRASPSIVLRDHRLRR